MSSSSTSIRASMLPAWPDCPRRSAAKSFWRDVEAAGFELRKLQPSIGAAVGTAVHKVAETILLEKIETGNLGKLDDGLEAAMVGFDEEIAPGAIWDDTTPNRNTAQLQIERLAKAYLGFAKTVDPLAVELDLKADAGDGFVLTGHIDLVTQDGWCRDLKTGGVDRPYYQQLGAYGLLVRSNQIVDLLGLAIDWVKRVGKTKPQPPAVVKEYPLGACQRAALEIVSDVKRCVLGFRKSGEPGIFTANPMSMMCSEKYCPAWGTDFCELSKGKI